MYADDLNVHVSAPSRSAAHDAAHRTVQTILDWARDNKMKISFRKSKYLDLSSNPTPIKSFPLQRDTKVKVLGAIFDEKLNFEA